MHEKKNLGKCKHKTQSLFPTESPGERKYASSFFNSRNFLTLVLKYINFHGTYRIFPQLSQENIVKVADVGVSKEAKAITGTMTGTPMYLAPEVIKSSLYDYKADIYSLGIMLWEMWYGNRALLDVVGNVQEFFEKVGEGVRPTHVRGSKKPPLGLHDLMQRCWDEKPDNRPNASECYKKLTKLYQEFGAPPS